MMLCVVDHTLAPCAHDRSRAVDGHQDDQHQAVDDGGGTWCCVMGKFELYPPSRKTPLQHYYSCNNEIALLLLHL